VESLGNEFSVEQDEVNQRRSGNGGERHVHPTMTADMTIRPER
jgi:hypothetical protein